MTLTERLARIRTRLAAMRGAHFMLDAGCSCGLPAGHFDASSIDTTIGGYLADKYRAAGRNELAQLFDTVTGSDGLSPILSKVIQGVTGLTDQDSAMLCDDLEPAVDSLEEMTRGRRRGAGRLAAV